MSDRPLNDFEMGYLCAVSNLIELHGADVKAEDTAREAGIKWAQIEASDLCEMDMINLRSIKGGKNCPFGSDGGEDE